MSMRTAGPNCCCCNDLIRCKENRQANGTPFLAHTTKPDEFIELAMFHNSPVARSPTAIGLDWVNKKMFYMETDGTDEFFRWWKVGSFAGIDGHDAPMTADVVTLEDYVAYSLATDADEEEIYFAGHDQPFPDGDADYSIDLNKMNYDGTGQTMLATLDLFRTGGPGGNSAMIGPMLVNRTERMLFYVVRENHSTANVNTWEISLRSRDLATFTESTLYTALYPGFGAQRGPTYIRQINSLSFDIADQKIYWVEHYYTASVRHESVVKRADYDGTGVEVLYTSADPEAVNFARFSNMLQKIVHANYNRHSTTMVPLDGAWIREKDWTEVRQISLIHTPDADIASPPSSHAMYLWCGYEKTGAGTLA